MYSVSRSVGFQDHPRVGGEKISTTSWPRCWKGSPPRGRGKGGHFPGRVRPQGITPAWAGKSRLRGPSGRRSEDHPRVGGEKSISAPSWGPGTGSPPRGRGKEVGAAVYHDLSGITPAWAGKSRLSSGAMLSLRDHPRVGGEKYCPECKEVIKEGSPPRGRGKD